jgi:hypothetical protein
LCKARASCPADSLGRRSQIGVAAREAFLVLPMRGCFASIGVAGRCFSEVHTPGALA